MDIPKPGGGTRRLGIPTVVDRLIQQAVLQVLEPLLDPTFSEASFGFRPKGSFAADFFVQLRGRAISFHCSIFPWRAISAGGDPELVFVHFLVEGGSQGAALDARCRLT